LEFDTLDFDPLDFRGMSHQNLWAPWRMSYLREITRQADDLRQHDEKKSADFLAEYWADPANDQRNLVIHRSAHGIILLNRYPYANGHLMTALGEARPTLLDYSLSQRAEFWKLIEIATDLSQRTLNPQGINTGINEGRAGGAGLPEHLHAHIVPRWNSDTNFLSVVGQVRVIPDALEEMWKQYRSVVERNPV
jgi:ATP adenylyltransferase